MYKCTDMANKLGGDLVYQIQIVLSVLLSRWGLLAQQLVDCTLCLYSAIQRLTMSSRLLITCSRILSNCARMRSAKQN